MTEAEPFTRRDCLGAIGAIAFAPALVRASAESNWSKIRAVLAEFVRERRAPGAALALCRRGGESAHLHSGTVAFDSEQAFDADSICRVYSMTKNVSRVATLLLVEDGKIELDQPVADFIPEFGRLRVLIDPLKGLDSRPAKQTMTVRHLITNTSGLANWTPASDSGDQLHALYRARGITPGNFGTGRHRPGHGPQADSMAEMVRRVSELPLAYEPGTALHYSIGFDVMALVIERVTGQPYGTFLQQRLWEPLGMDSTGFQVARKDAARLTTNYDATGRNVMPPAGAKPDPRLPPGWGIVDDRATSETFEPPRLLAGGASLLSTARDFLRYARMLQDHGEIDGTRVMSAETAALAMGDINPPGAKEPQDSGSRALMRGAPIIPPGTIGAGGAAGTLFWIDRTRALAAVFMVQVMYGSPANSPFQRPLFAAIDADLAAG